MQSFYVPFTTGIFQKSISMVVALVFGVLMVQDTDARSRTVSLTPVLSLGFASGYDKDKSVGFDLGNSGGMARLELQGAYAMTSNWSIYSGAGLAYYNYRMHFGNSTDRIKDTIRIQTQNLLEVPVGLRYIFSPRKKFATRHYLGGGLRFCFADGVSADFHTIDGSYSGNDKTEVAFNRMNVRIFLEGGWEIPVENNFAFVLGFSLSHAITRNMSKSGSLSDSNYGVLSGNGAVGFLFRL